MNTTDPVIERLRREIPRNRALLRLDIMAREVAGVNLWVLLPRENALREHVPISGASAIADFCKVLHHTEEGRKDCSKCHSLLAFAAVNRGLSEHRCHGGPTLLASPSIKNDGSPSKTSVVSTCLFRSGDRNRHWKTVRSTVKDLNVDLKKLKSAYFDLPTIPPARQKMLQHIVATTAEVVGEIETRIRTSLTGAIDSPPVATPSRIEERIGSALKLTGASGSGRRGKNKNATLMELIVEVIRGEPILPYTVSNIAHAARMTPNHFSMLFRKYTGQSFIRFLTEQRIERAKPLLLDLRFSIHEAAEQCGFDDPSYFARRFRQLTGRSPEEWRGSHR